MGSLAAISVLKYLHTTSSQQDRLEKVRTRTEYAGQKWVADPGAPTLYRGLGSHGSPRRSLILHADPLELIAVSLQHCVLYGFIPSPRPCVEIVIIILWKECLEPRVFWNILLREVILDDGL